MHTLAFADGSSFGRRGPGRDDGDQPAPGGRGGRQGQPRAQDRLPAPAGGASFWGDYDPVAAASQAAGGGRAQASERQDRRGRQQAAASAADQPRNASRSGRERDWSGGDWADQQPTSSGPNGQPPGQAEAATGNGLQSGPAFQEGQGTRKRGNRRSRSGSIAADAGEHMPTPPLGICHCARSYFAV